MTNLTLEQARKIYRQGNDEIREIVEWIFSKEKLERREKKREDFWEVEWYSIDNQCLIWRYIFFNSGSHTKNIRTTKEKAEASLAKSQLDQWMKKANDWWVPNWTDNKHKFIIYVSKLEVYKWITRLEQYFLSFKTQEIRDQFLKDRRKLIEQAKPLL